MLATGVAWRSMMAMAREMAPTDTPVGVFMDQARRRGDAPFVLRYSGSDWVPVSWSAAATSVRRLAASLVEAGVAPGDGVVLLADNSLEWILSDYAIQAAGGFTVPIYTSLLRHTVEHIVGDSGAKLAIAGTDELATKLAGIAGLDAVWRMEPEVAERIARDAAAESLREVDDRLHALNANDPATVVYTSGTTGEPKGVVLRHGGIAHMAGLCARTFDIGENDVRLSYLPFSHVLERINGTFTVVAGGGTTWIARGLERLPEDLQASQPTILIGAPRVFDKMYALVLSQVHDLTGIPGIIARWSLRVAENRSRRESGGGIAYRLAEALALRRVRRQLTGGRLRFFVSGGAPLNESVERFFWGAGIPILQGWGMTETSSAATANSLDQHRYGTVGHPLHGVELKIAEDGEILIKGPGLMRGYLHLEQQTRDTFDGEWLRTGDIGRMDADGYLVITDRKKELLKTAGGKYVAPLPVEATLAADPLIESAMLIGDERPYVVALLVPNREELARELHEKPPADHLGADPRIRALLQEKVEHVNQDLARFETIKRFAILDEDFSADRDELTPTFKPKRRVILQHYHDTIDRLYEPEEVAQRDLQGAASS